MAQASRGVRALNICIYLYVYVMQVNAIVFYSFPGYVKSVIAFSSLYNTSQSPYLYLLGHSHEDGGAVLSVSCVLSRQLWTVSQSAGTGTV